MPNAHQIPDVEEARRVVESVPVWYHTIDVAPGVVTPGQFDLRPIVDRLPWPDLTGKRCLDVGTYDGFWAFELERRGAAEVVATDIDDYLNIDWPPDYREKALEGIRGAEWPPPGTGFSGLARLKQSKVRWEARNIYDLNPVDLGTFDLVVCGSLLVHLRDPVRALEAIRSVTTGMFLSSEELDYRLTLLSRRRPLFTLDGSGQMCQWWNYNGAGHERLLYSAGFEIVERSRPYTVSLNVHPQPPTRIQRRFRAVASRMLTGRSDTGLLHQALLARPRL